MNSWRLSSASTITNSSASPTLGDRAAGRHRGQLRRGLRCGPPDVHQAGRSVARACCTAASTAARSGPGTPLSTRMTLAASLLSRAPDQQQEAKRLEQAGVQDGASEAGDVRVSCADRTRPVVEGQRGELGGEPPGLGPRHLDAEADELVVVVPPQPVEQADPRRDLVDAVGDVFSSGARRGSRRCGRSHGADPGSASPGAVEAAAIPRSRLMWALMPRRRCWRMIGRDDLAASNAIAHDRVGVPPAW